MTDRPSTVSAATILILADALVWAVLGFIAAADVHPGMPESDAVRWAMAISAFGCAAALVALAVLLRRRNRITYYLVVALLAAIAVVTVLDQFGLPDLAVLIIALLSLALLLKDRAWYLQVGRDNRRRT